MKKLRALSSLFRALTIVIPILLLIYLLISFYFVHHVPFNTSLNGVDVSLVEYTEIEQILKNHLKSYTLQLVELDGEIEEIRGENIPLQFNETSSYFSVLHQQSPLLWIGSIWRERDLTVDDLFVFDEASLERELSKLDCMTREDSVTSQNVHFAYANGSYQVTKEVQGNQIQKDAFYKAVEMSLHHGTRELNLLQAQCYEEPKFRLDSAKTAETLRLLNRYVSTKVSYTFGSEQEQLDGNTIHEWIRVDDTLDVFLDLGAIQNYVAKLSKQYDTVGITRKFKASSGKTIELKGGLYGWKINQAEEAKALLNHITLGETIEKEPIYKQKALERGDNEIGNTYVEVSITRQYVWFYQNGELITQGPVVTGNPKRGNATVTGAYMLNYKQKDATLRGANYTSKVTYWMPFFGNMGIHDAPWRYSFGGNIYQNNGTHGCINAPLQLAKVIFEHIEEGTPILIYEEQGEGEK